MKNLMIFGDSISTFKGHIPEGYACYYYEDQGPTDVKRVEDTWWYGLVQEGGFNLVFNESWSSSTISYRGLSGNDVSQTSSFIRRLDKHVSEGFFKKNKIDTVIFFGGTNDFWSEAPRGEIKHDNFTREELYTTLPAICCFMKKLREALPEAEIYCVSYDLIGGVVDEGFKAGCEENGMTFIKLADVDKVSNHPTIEGMKHIKNTILSAMGKK